jgi:antibiotic biosynthesis monooxygenase (ABM) superfamily enzyme
MDDGRATVFMGFHRGKDAPSFAAFAELVGADAGRAAGFAGWQLSVLASPLLEWAVAVHFRDERSLHAWLDGAGDLLTGHGPRRASLELFVDDLPRTPGVLLVRDVAHAGHEDGFVESAETLARLERQHPGYEGSSVFRPLGDDDVWSSVIRFRTEEHLAAWLASAERRRALPERQAHLRGESHVTTASSFGSTVRVTDGQAAVTPSWKTAMMVLLVLYPEVMLLGRFLNPVLNSVFPQPWLATFVNMVVSITLLTWVLMPLAARLLRRWLDPVDGAGVRANLLGTATVCASYALLLAIFASVGVLQLR